MWFFFFMILKNQDYKYFNEGRKLGPLIVFNWQYFSIGNSYFEKKNPHAFAKKYDNFPGGNNSPLFWPLPYNNFKYTVRFWILIIAYIHIYKFICIFLNEVYSYFEINTYISLNFSWEITNAMNVSLIQWHFTLKNHYMALYMQM